MSKVDKEGYLSKKGEINPTAQKRWFVLRGGDLSYYKKKGDSKPIKTLSIVDAEVSGVPDSNGKLGAEFHLIPAQGSICQFSVKNQNLKFEYYHHKKAKIEFSN